MDSTMDMRAMFQQQRAAMLPNTELCEWEWLMGSHLQTPSMHTLPMPLEVMIWPQPDMHHEHGLLCTHVQICMLV